MEKGYYINKYKQATTPKPTVIKITLHGSEGRRGYPQVRISVNKKIYFDKVIDKVTKVKFTVKELSRRNILNIEMVNKSPKDTLVDNGKIVKDKFVRIRNIYLDNIDIKNYIYQGKQKPIYHYENQGPKYNVGDHLFFNGPWKLFYNNPATQFLAWYNGRGQKINSYEKQVLKNRYLDRLNSLVNLKN
jgi:hypothetical protein